MKIKDLAGKEYEISTRRISELPLKHLSRFVLFSELRAAKGSGETPVRYRGENSETGPNCLLDEDSNSLGCRTFSPATFAKILKAAGVVQKTDKKKKKVARKKPTYNGMNNSAHIRL